MAEHTNDGPPIRAEIRYKVLRFDADMGTWEASDDFVSARSSEDAIRWFLLEGHDPVPSAMYVAIPERSWKPVTATAKQTTTLDLKPAT